MEKNNIDHAKNSIRFIRKQRKMTLRELSKLAGVTPSQLSMIERGLRNPSLSTLNAIAEALKVDKEVFWWNSVTEHHTKKASYTLVRKDHRIIYQGKYNSLLRYEEIVDAGSSSRDGKAINALIGRLEPGCNTNPFAPTQHDQAEFVYVISGEMLCEVESETIEMSAGDVIIIEPHNAHRFINNSGESVEVMMVRV